MMDDEEMKLRAEAAVLAKQNVHAIYCDCVVCARYWRICEILSQEKKSP